MKKNLAVIGYGGMGGWHAAYAKKSDVVTILGAYDIKEERAHAARDAGLYAYSSLDEVLTDPRIEIVVIATPNDVHKEIAVRALESGKHVICEKPVTLSSLELQVMTDASAKAGRVFTVHQNRRWDADFLAMKQLYDSGEIGDVFNIESRVHGSRGIPGDWRGMKKHGGGMLLDWGVHLIDQILLIVREKVISIFCYFDHITNDEVDDGFKLELFFANGCRSYIEVGTYNFISLPRYYMQGLGGTAIITDWHENARVVKRTHWHEHSVVPVRTAAGLTKTMAPRDSDTVEESELILPESDVHDFYRNVCAAIDGREKQIVANDEVMRVMKIIEAAVVSGGKRQRITVEL